MNKILPILSLSVLIPSVVIHAMDLSSAITASEDALKSSITQTAGFIQPDSSESNDSIIETLHEKWITIHENRNDFKPNQNIRRDEAAKMLTLTIPFIPSPLNKKLQNVSCDFKDSDKAWSDLKDILTESCEAWLFKWSNWFFNPQNSITNGQILTVLWRMLYGQQDESIGHYATKYISLLEADWYLEDIKIAFSERDMPAERWTLAKLLIRVIK